MFCQKNMVLPEFFKHSISHHSIASRYLVNSSRTHSGDYPVYSVPYLLEAFIRLCQGILKGSEDVSATSQGVPHHLAQLESKLQDTTHRGIEETAVLKGEGFTYTALLRTQVIWRVIIRVIVCCCIEKSRGWIENCMLYCCAVSWLTSIDIGMYFIPSKW